MPRYKSITAKGVRKLKSGVRKSRLAGALLANQPQGLLWENTKARDGIVFGFFGELGYGLISFWPYLAWLRREQNIPVRTAGLVGTGAFVPFSSEHYELDVPSGDSWGSAPSLLSAKKLLPQFRFIFGPWNGGPEFFSLGSEGTVWRRQSLHQNFDSLQNWAPLEFIQTVAPAAFFRQLETAPFWVVNIKEHFNWGNTGIPNFYFLDEIREITAQAKATGRYVVINRFPAPKEQENIEAPAVDFADLSALDNVIDLSHVYDRASTLTEANKIQISFLTNAERVFATQGGNASLSISCSRKVTVLLRGGLDYPGLVSLARRYNTELEFVHSAFQAKY